MADEHVNENGERPVEDEVVDEAHADAPDEVVGGPVAAAEDPTPEIGAVDAAEGPQFDEERSAEELVAALDEAQRTAEEYLDHLRRERADFENYRRRMNKERMDALDRGAEQLIANLLGVLDNFGFVLEAAKDSSDEQLAKGAGMVHSELMDVLRKTGLEEVPGKGAPFDPNVHEAMMQVESPEPVDQPVVAEVLRAGYRFKDRVLRPASVSVAQ